MLTFVVDDPSKRYDNLIPLTHDGYPLTESNWLLRWLDHYSIQYNMVKTQDASPESWYCVGINFWNFNCDYLQMLSPAVKEKLSRDSIRILFIYRESDDPRKIRQHIVDMALKHGFDPGLIWLVCGNSQGDRVPNTKFFWYFDYNYFFQTQNSPQLPINAKPRKRKITCLSRVHKHWREWFVYNLSRFASKDNYISYGAVQNDDPEDFKLWREDNRNVDGRMIDIIAPDSAWYASLPLTADTLNADQHNQHSIVVSEHFQDSYWNVVLETLLDTDYTGGVFVTEKTLKPIRNGQSFVILGCQGSLAFLQDRGYQTFNNAIDESYDDIESLHDRWYRVFEIAKELATADIGYLERLQARCLLAIEHNQTHFQRSRRNELIALAAYLDTV